jgi:hypothetical protein
MTPALWAACGAASAAEEQDLRGQYPRAAVVLRDEVRRLWKLEERVRTLEGVLADGEAGKFSAVPVHLLRSILGPNVLVSGPQRPHGAGK